MTTPRLQRAATNLEHFSEDHPDISEADIQAAISPNADSTHQRHERQKCLIEEGQQSTNDKRLNFLVKSDYNKAKKECRVSLQRLQQKWREANLKSDDYKKGLEELLLKTPVHSTIRVQVIRELLKLFYQQEPKV